MQFLGQIKNHETSQAKKEITQPIEPKIKITQPLGPKKNYATSRAKTKITQPLGPKKNHRTSWAKKKSPNFSGQKKIMQPIGQQKSCNLGPKKIT